MWLYFLSREILLSSSTFSTIKNLLLFIKKTIYYYVLPSTIFYILLCYVMEEKITTQMKKGVLEYIILAIIAK